MYVCVSVSSCHQNFTLPVAPTSPPAPRIKKTTLRSIEFMRDEPDDGDAYIHTFALGYTYYYIVYYTYSFSYIHTYIHTYMAPQPFKYTYNNTCGPIF